MLLVFFVVLLLVLPSPLLGGKVRAGVVVHYWTWGVDPALVTLPDPWLPCDGQHLSKTIYGELYDKLGSVYSINTSHFALPDLKGRSVLGVGATYPLNVKGGEETTTLLDNQLPKHTHTMMGSNNSTGLLLSLVPDPSRILGNALLDVLLGQHFRSPIGATLGTLRSDSLSTEGGNQAHENMQPFLVLMSIVASRTVDVLPRGAVVAYVGQELSPSVTELWVPCNGSANTPDLRERVPLHHGQGTALSNRVYGTWGGLREVTLTLSQLPSHTHGMQGTSSSGTSPSPLSNVISTSLLGNSTTSMTTMNTSSLQSSGEGKAHNNMGPSLVVHYIVALADSSPPPGTLVHFAGQLASAMDALPSGGEMWARGQDLNPWWRPDLTAIRVGGNDTNKVVDTRGLFLTGSQLLGQLLDDSVGGVLGAATELLTSAHVPVHKHIVAATQTSLLGGGSLSSKVLSGLSDLSLPIYLGSTVASVALAAETILSAGADNVVEHSNLHPYLPLETLLYCDEICTTNLAVGVRLCLLTSGVCWVEVAGAETLAPDSYVQSNLNVVESGSFVVDLFASAKLNVQKNATLAGNLTLVVNEPVIANTTFVILTAAAIEGQFSHVTVTAPGVTRNMAALRVESTVFTGTGCDAFQTTVQYSSTAVSVLLQPAPPSSCVSSSGGGSGGDGSGGGGNGDGDGSGGGGSARNVPLILGVSIGVGVPLVIAIVVIAILVDRAVRVKRAQAASRIMALSNL